MAKNDWRFNDYGTTGNMNAPLWIANGTYVGGTLTLDIGPGWVRFPTTRSLAGNFRALVGSGQAQQLVIANATAARDYTIYVRSNGAFLVSGTSLGLGGTFPEPAVMGQPRWDAEYLGTVRITAGGVVFGPWNAGAFGGYEQRGAYFAGTVGTPRMVYRSVGNADPQTPTFLGSVYGAVNSGAVASGIAFLTMDQPVDYAASPGVGVVGYEPRTHVEATVTWCASGIRSQQPVFFILPAGGDKSVVAQRLVTWTDQKIYWDPTTGAAVYQNAFSSTPYEKQSHTAHLHGVDTRNLTGQGGYGLYAYIDTTRSDTGSLAQAIHIQEIRFTARPGIRAINTTEPAD